MEPRTSWIPYAAVAVVVVLIGAGLGLYVYYHGQPKSAPSLKRVHVGDNVTVNYIGVFGSGPQVGHVFDTSIFSVATNGASWPKSLQYAPRGATPKSFSPLDVHVGPNTPSGGYSIGNQSFISVVPGFWEGLVGLPGNQTAAVNVPPALGYGGGDPGCVRNQPLVQTLPVLVTVSRANFTSSYPGITAQTSSTFTDPHYGWPVYVLSANATSITMENQPSIGETSSPAGWPVEVTAVNSTTNGSGRITLQNELTPADAGVVLGTLFQGTAPCTTGTSSTFIVTSVNLLNGTFTENFNREVDGQTLIFLVTVLNILP
ncbi:MAG: FKBP-type peptidyl-prolyl cis-trans isomerase [Thermoplasmata archaeon]|nr:FKBP-type peptidyl-prolyl cis-trans isomerase [Thermoplasmata archaeon]